MELTEKLSIEIRKAKNHREVINLLAEKFKISFTADVIGIYEVEDTYLRLSVNLSPEIKAPKKYLLFQTNSFSPY